MCENFQNNWIQANLETYLILSHVSWANLDWCRSELDSLHIQTFVSQQSYITRKVFEITVKTGNSERFSQRKIVIYCQVVHYLVYLWNKLVIVKCSTIKQFTINRFDCMLKLETLSILIAIHSELHAIPLYFLISYAIPFS